VNLEDDRGHENGAVFVPLSRSRSSIGVARPET
jgi:hypothetical protein